MSDETVIQLALDRFRTTADAETEQRTAELEDIKFVDFDDQWPEDVRRQRDGSASTNGLPPVPPRPCLTINQLRQPVQTVINQARAARLQLQFAPKGNGADRETADVFEDIARAVQVDSRAHLARLWALGFAVKSGRGYYRILTEYANDGDDDLDIVYRRILNPQTVYYDPFAQEPDFSDAEWCFITEDMPWSRYKLMFGESKLASCDDSELSSIGDNAPGWVNGDTDASRTVRVAEYFAVEHTKRTKVLVGAEWLWRDELQKDFPDDQILKSREVDQRSVVWRKINGCEVLEESPWPGRYIPIIPVVGDECNANGKRAWVGIVRPAKDAQRSYNYSRSTAVETGGLQPRQPYVGYMETIEGYEQWWNQANVRNFGILPVRAVSFGGQVLPVPQRQSPSADLSSYQVLTGTAKDDIHATTGVPPVALGQLDPHERSGKAIQALQNQADQGSSGYLDNLASCSMIYEGKILRDLIPKVFDRPGRIVAAMGADDQRRSVMLNAPHIMKGNEPQPVPEGTQGAKVFDLSKGEYTVAITIGKAHTTRREEAVAGMGQLAEAAPNLVQFYADKWVENMDFPGSKQIADRLKKVLPPQVQDDASGQEIPPAVQQQMQQLAQMLQMTTKELEAKTKEIEGDTVTQQWETRRAEMDNATKLEIARLNAQKDIATAEIKNQMAGMQQQIALLQAMLGASHESAMQGREHAHQQTQAQASQDAAMQQMAAQQGHEAQMAQQAPPQGAA